jgi:hypothetical protein
MVNILDTFGYTLGYQEMDDRCLWEGRSEFLELERWKNDSVSKKVH